MSKCTFCGNNIERGTGKIYVQKDAKILNFCSMRCEKNHIKLGRKFLETKWSKKFKREKQEVQE
jgi:large subunit ribosomal protein L24e|tara:strand:+ start:22693 stop:22884 length:192 start_codon:yes stop_codon:yes gene_type:complete